MRDMKIRDAIHIADLEFQHDPSYCDCMFRWIPGEDPHTDNLLPIKLYDRKYTAANGNRVSFHVRIDADIHIGDYLYQKNTKQYWICTELYNENEIHLRGLLTECNWFLKWQRPDGTILEYPCQDMNSTQYNSGEYSDKVMTLGSSQHMLTLQANSDTISLCTPQRFFVSLDYSIPYVVTQNDSTTLHFGENGLVRITVTQDEIHDDDNQELGICDYFVPTTLPPDPGKPYYVYIDGRSDLLLHTFRTYAVRAETETGEPIDIDVDWKISSEFDNHLVCISDSNSSSLVLTNELEEILTNEKNEVLILKTHNKNEIRLRVDDESLKNEMFFLQACIGNAVVAQLQITIKGLF